MLQLRIGGDDGDPELRAGGHRTPRTVPAPRRSCGEAEISRNPAFLVMAATSLPCMHDPRPSPPP
jgi:hypothetical protein